MSSTLDCTSILLTSSTPWVKARLKFFLCGDSSFDLGGGNFNGQIYRQRRNCDQFSLKEPRHLKMTNKHTWEVSWPNLKSFKLHYIVCLQFIKNSNYFQGLNDFDNLVLYQNSGYWQQQWEIFRINQFRLQYRIASQLYRGMAIMVRWNSWMRQRRI